MSAETVQETIESEGQEPRTYTEEEMGLMAQEIADLRASESHYKSELSKINSKDAEKRVKIRELTAMLEGREPEQAEEPVSETVSRNEFETLKADLRRRDYQDLLNAAAEKANANPRLVRSLMMEDGVPQDLDFTDLGGAAAEIDARLAALIEEVPEIQKKTGASSQHQDWVGPDPVDSKGMPRDIPAHLEKFAETHTAAEVLEEYQRVGGDQYAIGMVEDPAFFIQSNS